MGEERVGIAVVPFEGDEKMLECPRCRLEFPRDPYKPITGYYATCKRCNYGPFWSESAVKVV